MCVLFEAFWSTEKYKDRKTRLTLLPGASSADILVYFFPVCRFFTESSVR